MGIYSYDELRENNFSSVTAYDTLYESKLFKSANEVYVSDYDKYDIFLSHSYQDRQIIPFLKSDLERRGFKVYVDWIDDKLLSRESVTADTAKVLQKRMRQSESLIFATSENSPSSKWMPWELGYFDALKNKRVAILPLKTDLNRFGNSFKGQEYLGLYYWIDKMETSLFINGENNKFVSFREWIRGKEPYSRG